MGPGGCRVPRAMPVGWHVWAPTGGGLFRPYRAWAWVGVEYPGRCPGLECCGPFGAGTRADCRGELPMSRGETTQILGWVERYRAGDDSAMNELLLHFEGRLIS